MAHISHQLHVWSTYKTSVEESETSCSNTHMHEHELIAKEHPTSKKWSLSRICFLINRQSAFSCVLFLEKHEQVWDAPFDHVESQIISYFKRCQALENLEAKLGTRAPWAPFDFAFKDVRQGRRQETGFGRAEFHQRLGRGHSEGEGKGGWSGCETSYQREHEAGVEQTGKHHGRNCKKAWAAEWTRRGVGWASQSRVIVRESPRHSEEAGLMP